MLDNLDLLEPFKDGGINCHFGHFHGPKKLKIQKIHEDISGLH